MMNDQILSIHQPTILKPLNIFNIDETKDYFNEEYLATQLEDKIDQTQNLLTDIKDEEGTYLLSITGKVLTEIQEHEQLKKDLRKARKKGDLKIAAETFHRSISHEISTEEFTRQVKKHQELIKDVMGEKAKIFLDTANGVNEDTVQTLKINGITTIITDAEEHYKDESLRVIDKNTLEIEEVQDDTTLTGKPLNISYSDTLALEERELETNDMQTKALEELKAFESKVKNIEDSFIERAWRLLTCQHVFETMCNDDIKEDKVHPHNSPYETHATFMNILNSLARHITAQTSDLNTVTNKQFHNTPSKVLN